MKKWYAVQEYAGDTWGYGSHDFAEAKEMLRLQGCGLIAVIEDDICTEKLQFDDLFKDDFYYYLLTDAGTDYWHNDCFALVRGVRDEDGKEDPAAEERILQAAYVDLPGYDDACTTYIDTYDGREETIVDIDRVYDLIEEYITEKLGFCPDYD